MAAITELSEDFSTPANGVEITTANSIFDNISGTASGQPTCTTSTPLDASAQPKAARFVTSASTRICRADLAAPATYMWVMFYFRPITAPATNTAIFTVYDGATKIMDVRYTSAGGLQLRDGNTAIWTSAALTAAAWHRVAVKCDPGETAQGLRLRIYSGGSLHGTTPSQDSSLRGSTLGLNASDIRLGVISNDAIEYYATRLRADTAVEPAALSGVANIAPVANAGPNQIDIEPYSTVTLNGSDSYDEDGSITTYTWTQTAGPTVTLTGASSSPARTFTAPAVEAGTTLTFQLVVSDGTTSSTADTVDIAILNHNEFYWNGSAFVPFQRQYYNGTTLIPV